MAEPKVSVIVPTQNSASTLEKCLVSIKSIDVKYKFELIVVDAGSSDNTMGIARRYADKVLMGVPDRINRNQGVRSAEGEIVCFTDSDCIVPENWVNDLVEKLLELNRKDNKIVGIGGGNLPLLDGIPLMARAVNLVMRSPLVSFRARNTAVYEQDREVLHNPPMNSAFFKWVIDEVGGFIEDYGYGGEDLELDAKITSKGYKLYYTIKPVVWHDDRRSFGYFLKRMYRHGISRIRVGSKYRRYLEFHHFGPLFLCLMSFSPLLVIPCTMSLANGMWVSIQKRDAALLFPAALLTWGFYISYGLGEIVQLVRG